MGNKTLYCLDCEQDFCDSLVQEGFNIVRGNLGYTKKRPKSLVLPEPPNECDLLIFNLEDPACFDMLSWGPDGDNDNFRSKLVEKFDKSLIARSSTSGLERRYPRYRLVQETHIDERASLFNSIHLQRAIFQGGIDCIYYMNPSFMFHSLGNTPSWPGFSFDSEITRCKKWYISDTASKVCEQLKDLGNGDLEIVSPIEFKLWKIKVLPHLSAIPLQRFDLFVNNINEALAAIVKFGEGLVYFLPPFADRVTGTIKLMESVIPAFRSSSKDTARTQTRQEQAVTRGARMTLKQPKFIPSAMFTETREYIVQVVAQINGCYSSGFFDACAAMMRRLVETLLIEIYETHGRLEDIKSKGEILGLEKLIEKVFNDSKVHISRNVRKILQDVKLLGDTGSHNRKVNLKRHNIDDLKSEYKIAIQELLQNAKFR